jgi:hypothetical protein
MIRRWREKHMKTLALQMVNLEIMKLTKRNIEVIDGNNLKLPDDKITNCHNKIYKQLSQDQLITIIHNYHTCVLNIFEELKVDD